MYAGQVRVHLAVNAAYWAMTDWQLNHQEVLLLRHTNMTAKDRRGRERRQERRISLVDSSWYE